MSAGTRHTHSQAQRWRGHGLAATPPCSHPWTSLYTSVLEANVKPTQRDSWSFGTAHLTKFGGRILSELRECSQNGTDSQPSICLRPAKIGRFYSAFYSATIKHGVLRDMFSPWCKHWGIFYERRHQGRGLPPCPGSNSGQTQRDHWGNAPTRLLHLYIPAGPLCQCEASGTEKRQRDKRHSYVPSYSYYFTCPLSVLTWGIWGPPQ